MISRTTMSTTEMWDVYYEEEKRKMEECLARLMSSTTDDVKISNSQSVHGSMTAQQMGKRKQFIIDALLKIRGRVQLKHEESLKKQQEALIMTVDDTIKKEEKKRKEEFFQAVEAYAVTRCLQGIAETFALDYHGSPNESTGRYKPSVEDQQSIDDTVHETTSQFKIILDRYMKRKRELALQVLNVELESICSSHIQNISLDEVKRNLQQDLKSLMEESIQHEEKYWNIKVVGDKPKDKEKDLAIRSLLSLHKRNLQMAAQICVLRELKGK